ncbi:hypothetical protein BDK51DRAFT_42743, partial [Blyttiomyces helicus]
MPVYRPPPSTRDTLPFLKSLKVPSRLTRSLPTYLPIRSCDLPPRSSTCLPLNPPPHQQQPPPPPAASASQPAPLHRRLPLASHPSAIPHHRSVLSSALPDWSNLQVHDPKSRNAAASSASASGAGPSSSSADTSAELVSDVLASSCLEPRDYHSTLSWSGPGSTSAMTSSSSVQSGSSSASAPPVQSDFNAFAPDANRAITKVGQRHRQGKHKHQTAAAGRTEQFGQQSETSLPAAYARERRLAIEAVEDAAHCRFTRAAREARRWNLDGPGAASAASAPEMSSVYRDQIQENLDAVADAVRCRLERAPRETSLMDVSSAYAGRFELAPPPPYSIDAPPSIRFDMPPETPLAIAYAAESSEISETRADALRCRIARASLETDAPDDYPYAESLLSSAQTPTPPLISAYENEVQHSLDVLADTLRTRLARANREAFSLLPTESDPDDDTLYTAALRTPTPLSAAYDAEVQESLESLADALSNRSIRALVESDIGDAEFDSLHRDGEDDDPQSLAAAYHDEVHESLEVIADALRGRAERARREVEAARAAADVLEAAYAAVLVLGKADHAGVAAERVFRILGHLAPG